MGLNKLGYTIVFVKDFQGAKDFYSKILGLEITQVTDEGQWATLGFPGGGAQLAIHGGLPITRGSDEGVPPVVPSIAVSDITATVADLKERGVEFTKDIREIESGVKMADFVDSEGNLLQLMEAPHH